MSSRFYEKRSSPTSLFGATSARSEIDLRLEFERFMDGHGQEISKKQPALLRRMQRDANGSLIQCACVDELTGEPDLDVFCPLCHGEGYYWDEVWVDVYPVELGSDIGKAIREQVIQPGLMNVPLMIFYLRSSVDITQDDKIIEVIRDKEGLPVQPYRREKLYRINALLDLRADGGRLEYWKLDCYAEDRKFLNG